MYIIDINEIKANPAKYINMIETGAVKEIVIYKNGVPTMKITSFVEKKNIQRIGAGKDIIKNVPDSIKEGFEDIPEEFGY